MDNSLIEIRELLYQQKNARDNPILYRIDREGYIDDEDINVIYKRLVKIKFPKEKLRLSIGDNLKWKDVYDVFNYVYNLYKHYLLSGETGVVMEAVVSSYPHHIKVFLSPSKVIFSFPYGYINRPTDLMKVHGIEMEDIHPYMLCDDYLPYETRIHTSNLDYGQLLVSITRNGDAIGYSATSTLVRIPKDDNEIFLIIRQLFLPDQLLGGEGSK